MSKKFIKLQSPCKLNFGLWVKNKREDGFHEIETIFYEHRDFCDSLQVDFVECDETKINSRFLQENLNKIIPSNQNLTTLATRLFLEKAKITGSFNILIDKKIPFQAGLGGASSNAASILKGLNNLFGNKFKTPELIEIALKIGSDVPFFMLGGTCHAKSRGELLSKIENNLKLNIKIVKPENIFVLTKWAYEQIDLKVKKHDRAEKISNLIKAISTSNYNLFYENIFNDFEDLIFMKFPELFKFKMNLLDEGYKAVCLCGSGSALLAIR